MSSAKPITIVGGGLAGLTLGIALRQQEIPVAVWEAGQYPRHRVCGEFISGAGLDVLGRLALREPFVQAGAIRATTAAFFSPKAKSPIRALPVPALCLSRFAMDGLLAEVFRNSGGELKESARWKDSEPRPGLVRASGRRLKAVDRGWRWFGLKVHAANVALTADLEMHLAKNSYVGLCRLGNGEINVCGLFRRRAGAHDSPQERAGILRGTPGSILNDRLAGGKFDESSFCSVAGLSLDPQRAASQNDCCIGDALTMIAPVTGNGMSMAFESAGIATGPLTAYSRAEISWQEAQAEIARRCDETFGRRLSWAKWVQWLMFSPALQGSIGSIALRSEWLWRIMFTRTR